MSQIVYQTTAAERHDTIPVLLRKLSQKLGVPVLQGDSVYNTMFRILRDQSWTLGSAVNYVNVAAHRRQFSVIPARHDTLQVLFYKFGMRTGFVIEGNDFLRREVIKQALAAAGTTPTPEPEPEPEPEPLDPDVVSFVTRAGLTEEIHISAVSDLVETLKLSGVWGQSLVLYPFVGGTALAHSQNLKSSDFPITWVGSVTHDADGILSDGSTGYGRTGFIANDHITSINSAFLHAYVGSNGSVTANLCPFGALTGGRASLLRSSAGIFTFNGLFNGIINSLSVAGAGGNLIVVRSSGVSQKFYTDIDESAELITPVTTMTTVEHYVAARNNGGTPINFYQDHVRFAAIGDGISVGQKDDLMAAVITFQTALGRAV